MLDEKLTTLSLFSPFLNRLVKMLSQMGLTDDNFLPLILVPGLSPILVLTSFLNIC